VHRLLIVDDDSELTDLLREFLEPEGFVVETAQDGAACLGRDPESHDLIVLDVMLPALSGFEVLKQLRQRSSIPVIMLTARDGDIDRIVGLELGADDYVPKPVNPRELVARIRAVLRRTFPIDARPGEKVTVGDLRLDASTRNVWSTGRKLDLTTAEFNLLQHLLRNVGQIVSRDDLSVASFDRRYSAGTDRNVDTLVSKVRRKLGPASDSDSRIKTVRNVGYIYVRPRSETPQIEQTLAVNDES
jgi:two-component system response regulator CpxR